MHSPYYVKFVSGVPHTESWSFLFAHRCRFADFTALFCKPITASRRRPSLSLSSCYLPYTSHRGAFLMSRRRLRSRSARRRRRRRRFITELTQSGTTTTTTTTELLSRQQRRHWRRTRLLHFLRHFAEGRYI